MKDLEMRTTMAFAEVLLAPAIGLGQRVPGPVHRIPFATIRAAMHVGGRDSVPFFVDGGKEGDDRWVQIAFGKKLKVHAKDRKAESEKPLGGGLVIKDGFIDINVGWRGYAKRPVTMHFDGTLEARLALVMSAGKWEVRVVKVKSRGWTSRRRRWSSTGGWTGAGTPWSASR